jgi:CRP/FNR family transcriptional regulator, cyclic AMP receptor protein
VARASAKVELLRNVPLFSGLSTKELMSLSRLMDEVDLKPGTVIIREGNTGGEFFIVIEGTVEVKRGGRRLARLGPGDYLGEIALIDHGPRTATAIVETPTRVLVLASREFHSMLASDPRIENKILRTLAARVRDMSPRSVAH